MGKDEKNTYTVSQRLTHLARLVYAMRRAQKLLPTVMEGEPGQKADVKRAVEGYEKSVDYMLEKILGML